MEGFNGGELVIASFLAPICKSPRRVKICLARMVVINLSGEEFDTRLAAFGVGVNSRAGSTAGAGEGTNSPFMAG